LLGSTIGRNETISTYYSSPKIRDQDAEWEMLEETGANKKRWRNPAKPVVNQGVFQFYYKYFAACLAHKFV
jgi:hypothetical protein